VSEDSLWHLCRSALLVRAVAEVQTIIVPTTGARRLPPPSVQSVRKSDHDGEAQVSAVPTKRAMNTRSSTSPPAMTPTVGQRLDTTTLIVARMTAANVAMLPAADWNQTQERRATTTKVARPMTIPTAMLARPSRLVVERSASQPRPSVERSPAPACDGLQRPPPESAASCGSQRGKGAPQADRERAPAVGRCVPCVQPVHSITAG
jgi:hypothetical protein